MIDLHTHSSASDGDYSPRLLVEEAAKRGLTTLALTDHDTLAGLPEAAAASREAGIAFVPGIELNIAWEGSASGGEFHLLGLGLSRPSPGFLAAVENLARLREKRNLAILDLMNEQGIEATYDEVRSYSGGHSVGRPHFAAVLAARRLAKDREDAFKRFLAPGRPLYVPKKGLPFPEAAALIHESGGVAVMAHPLSLYVGWTRLPELVKALRGRGLDGLEAWHPLAKPRACRRLEALAASLDLLVTEGSDFHGPSRPSRRLGYSSRGRPIECAVPSRAPPARP